MKQEKKQNHAIFWDYRKLDLRKKEYTTFFQALRAFKVHNLIQLSKVFYQESNLSYNEIPVLNQMRSFPFIEAIISEKNLLMMP